MDNADYKAMVWMMTAYTGRPVEPVHMPVRWVAVCQTCFGPGRKFDGTKCDDCKGTGKR